MIYVDLNFHCHTTNLNGVYREVETDFFNDKCDVFIKGYCYDDSKGYVQIYPWKPYSELDSAQRDYERVKLAQLENKEQELNTSYQEGINSI